jgi:hypothetical protein
MINGRTKLTKAVIAGLAKELDSDPRYLEKLAAEIGKPPSKVTSDRGSGNRLRLVSRAIRVLATRYGVHVHTDRRLTTVATPHRGVETKPHKDLQ